jgi:hypothetical protein
MDYIGGAIFLGEDQGETIYWQSDYCFKINKITKKVRVVNVIEDGGLHAIIGKFLIDPQNIGAEGPD